MQAFPMPAGTDYNYADAFSRRPGGHHGTDILARAGTPVLAVVAGRARKSVDPKGGNVVYLETRDGARYYYAHLDDWIGHFPRQVSVGEAIGVVGNSGNARGRPSHLHFQVSLPGQGTIDPFPLLIAVDTEHRAVHAPAESRASTAPGDGGAIILLLGLLWLIKN